MSRSIRNSYLLCVGLLLLLTAASAEALVTVLPAHSTVVGKTIGKWTQDWWSWALSLPVPNDPLSDKTGANANNNQSGPIFFIGGTTGFSTARTFNVPADKFLLLPLVNNVGTDSDVPGGTPADLVTLISGFLDQVDSLNATLDGTSIPQSSLFLHRETSGIFPLNVAPGSVFDFPGGVPAGMHPFAFSDGFWLMLAPLSAGPHEIDFGGGSSSFSVSVQDHLTSVPEPSGLVMLGTGMGLVCVLTRRRFYRSSRHKV
jgi:hypothetical protein